MTSHATTRRARSRTACTAVALACALGLAACADDPADDPADVNQTESVGESDTSEGPEPEDIDEGAVEGTASEPTMETMELLQNPGDHVGETVVVEAQVGEVLGDRAFTIVTDEADEAQGAEERLLAVGSGETLEQGDVVVVGGTVQEGLDLVEVQDRLGVDWSDDEALQDFGGMEWLDVATVEIR